MSSSITESREMEAYLRAREINFASIDPLSGGTANFVWRLNEATGSTKVIKHAEAYIKDARDMAFPVNRMDFEAHALETIPQLVREENDAVHAAKIYSYDKNQHVIIISDGGKTNLKEEYANLSVDTALAAGKALGKWLAALHKATSGPTAVKVRKSFDNSIAKAMYRYSYYQLAPTITEFGLDNDSINLAKKLNEDFGSLLERDDDCVCHGDFWPGNVLCNETMQLTIVDWEMTRSGCGATDVGQFAAESWLLDHFRGGKGLCLAFLDEYAQETGRVHPRDEHGRNWAIRLSAHFGTHLAFWPIRVKWGTEKETREVVKYGLTIIEKSMQGDTQWLRENTPLTNLIPLQTST